MSELQKKIKEKELKLIKEFLHSVTFRGLPQCGVSEHKAVRWNEDTNVSSPDS